jgi:hypothetical protein
VQTVVISVLVLNYSGRATAAAVFVAGLAAAGVSLFSDNVTDLHTLGYLQAGAGVLGVASKLPQILAIWQEGGTGQLSAFAVSIISAVSYRLELIQLQHRSSTTSSARSLASSRPCKRWMTS